MHGWVVDLTNSRPILGGGEIVAIFSEVTEPYCSKYGQNSGRSSAFHEFVLYSKYAAPFRNQMSDTQFD